MSLILEALKKLERDKQVPDRGGFLVMAARPWPSADDSSRRLFFASLALAGFGLAGLTGAGVWWWSHRQGSVHGGGASAVVLPADAPVASATRKPVSASRAPVAQAATSAPSLAHAVAGPAAAVPPPRKPATAGRAAEPAPGAAVQPPIAPAVVEAAAKVEPAPAQKPLADLRLTAISQRDGKRVAILNDRTVYEGDSFDGVTVVRIGDNEVELNVNGQRRIIEF